MILKERVQAWDEWAGEETGHLANSLTFQLRPSVWKYICIHDKLLEPEFRWRSRKSCSFSQPHCPHLSPDLIPLQKEPSRHPPPEQCLVHTHQQDPSDHLTFRPAYHLSILTHFFPSMMPLYNTWHNLKSPHLSLCSPVSLLPVPIEYESEVMGPCVSLVTAVSPEPPVCLTPVSSQKQLLRTNGQRRGPQLCSVWCHCLVPHPWSWFFFHTEGWYQLR